MHIASLVRLRGRAAAALLVVAAANVAIAAPVGAVNASTQKFFGFSENSGGNGKSSPPASCDISAQLKQNDELNAQIAKINDDAQAKMNEISQEMKDVQPGDSTTLRNLENEQNSVLQTSNAQVQAIKLQQDAIQKQSSGPSDQCKRDTVAQAVTEMQGLQAALNGSLNSTLDKVDNVVAEINALVPKLSAAGVNGNDIATAKSDLAAVQSDSTALRGFLAQMGTEATSFVASATADPIGTYDAMQSRHSTLSGGATSGASTAADDLVTRFTSLVNLFDSLTGTTEGQ